MTYTPFRPSPIAPLLCALGASALVSAPCEALAEETYRGYAGLFLSVSLGDQPNLGLGAAVRFAPLVSEEKSEAGIFVQGSWLNFSLAARVAGGLYGETPREGYNLYGEAGWTYRSALGEESPGGHGPHAAIGALSVRSLTDFALRSSLLLFGRESHALEVSPTIGLRYYPDFANRQTIDGRPLYIEDELRHASLRRDHDWC